MSFISKILKNVFMISPVVEIFSLRYDIALRVHMIRERGKDFRERDGCTVNNL